jgi:Uma2 family endonuclease
MSITTQLFTAEDLLKMPEDGFRYELVQGELIKMAPPGFEHGGIAVNIIGPLDQHVRANNLGMVVSEVGFQLAHNPDTVRAPDVAYVRQERLQQIGKPKEYFPGAPDLAVEIISPNDIYSDVDDKVGEWLHFGAQMVIVVNPRRHTVTVYHAQFPTVFLTENDTLDGGDMVPGWTMPVRSIFS